MLFRSKKKGSRETIGSIKDGVFKISPTYLLKEKNKQLQTVVSQKAHDADGDTPSEPEGSPAAAVSATVDEILTTTKFDRRAPERIEVPMLTLALGSMMSALSGNTGCTEISEAISNRFKPYFKKHLPRLVVERVSHDTVRNTMLLVDTGRFDSFFRKVLSQLPKVKPRVTAADGQAVRATGSTDAGHNGHKEVHGAYMLMNFYDEANRICLAHTLTLIEKKTNEIAVGPDELGQLNIEGAVVTADAMSCQVNFVETALKGGAHYCISLKGNQDRTFSEVRYLFNSQPDDRLVKYRPEAMLDHGRIETNELSLLRGGLLSNTLKDRWQGLKEGCIARVVRTCIKKTTGEQSVDERFFISSIPALEANAKRIFEVIRAHWSIENRLHWMLDMRFSQDRVQANEPRYIANRSALNKLALAFLEHYRFWLWTTNRERNLLSVNLVQQRCLEPEVAMECLACGLGLLA